jgi:hypothetical protein
MPVWVVIGRENRENGWRMLSELKWRTYDAREKSYSSSGQ